MKQKRIAISLRTNEYVKIGFDSTSNYIDNRQIFRHDDDNDDDDDVDAVQIGPACDVISTSNCIWQYMNCKRQKNELFEA